MSAPAQSGVFELLRFSAVPVTADIAVVEVEGRFARDGRFARHPQLVIEGAAGRSIELPPVDTVEGEGRWHGTFAVPARALDGSGFALGIRGALLELPAPDVDDGDRLAALAREANALRRRLEAAEARAQEAVATAAAATDAERDAAVAEASQRADAAQRAVSGAQTAAREAQGAAREAEARADAEASRRSEAAETRAVAAEQERERLQELLDHANGELDQARRRTEDAHAEARDLRRQLKGARAELEAQRRRARPVPVRARPTAAELVNIAHAGLPPDEPDEPEARAGDDTTAQRPAAVPEPATTAMNHDRPIESVKVLGRPARRPNPVPPAPAADQLPTGPPSPLRWVAVGALVLFLLVLVLLLF